MALTKVHTLVEENSVVQPEEWPCSAVVVNFRRYDLLSTCIAALNASSIPPDEVIVVDNESEAAKLTEFAARYPSVEVIANETNAGFATACNQGWRASSRPFVLFVNPDVTVERECLRECLAAISEARDIGVVTCRLVLPDGRLDHACHRGIPTPLASLAYMLRLHKVFPHSRRLGRYTMSWLDPLSVHDVEACSGAFMLVRREVLAEAGGWDEGYWFYAEDLDLCLRIGRLGKRVRYLGTTTAIHLKGASSHLRERTRELSPGERITKRKVQAAIIDSHRRFFRQHFEKSTPWPVRTMIRAVFATQRIRLSLATRLDGIRGA
ncbi:MAG: glycosyltransferase family 2 protein [Chloroflexota bacterium]